MATNTDCKFGCVDSLVYKSVVDGGYHCCNCGRDWYEKQTLGTTGNDFPDDGFVLVADFDDDSNS